MTDVGTPPTDDSLRLFKLLGDMQWHSFFEIRDQISELVPPGRAIRAYEKDLNYRRQYRNDPNYNTALSDDEREKIGRRKCASIAISAWREKGLEIRGEGSKKEMRIRPGFTSWSIPGFEPKPEASAPDPPSEPEGPTDPPPDDSEAAEAPVPVVEAPPSPQVVVAGPPEPAEPVQAPEPVEEPVKVEKPVKAIKPAKVEELVVETVKPEPDTYQADVEAMHQAFIDEQLNRLTSQPTVEPAPVSPTVGVTAEGVPVTACSLCGMGIVDEPLHTQWHEAESQAEARNDAPLWSPSQLEAVVRDVTGQLLDHFQEGLQDWLAHEFAQVHGAIAVNRAPRTKWATRTDHH